MGCAPSPRGRGARAVPRSSGRSDSSRGRGCGGGRGGRRRCRGGWGCACVDDRVLRAQGVSLDSGVLSDRRSMLSRTRRLDQISECHSLPRRTRDRSAVPGSCSASLAGTHQERVPSPGQVLPCVLALRVPASRRSAETVPALDTRQPRTRPERLQLPDTAQSQSLDGPPRQLRHPAIFRAERRDGPREDLRRSHIARPQTRDGLREGLRHPHARPRDVSHQIGQAVGCRGGAAERRSARMRYGDGRVNVMTRRGGTRWRRFKGAVATLRARNVGMPAPRIEAAVRDALAAVRAARRTTLRDGTRGHR